MDFQLLKMLGRKQLIQYRNLKGKFKSVFDIAKAKPSINKRVLESLILVGALDSLIEHRSQMFESLDLIVNFISKFHKTSNHHQASLFQDDSVAIQVPKLIDVENWDKETCLKHEKELLGFYLSENPLYKYEKDIKELTHSKTLGSQFIPFGGIITNIQYRYDKNGNKWALISLETLETNIQLYVFNDKFLKYEDIVKDDNILYVIGKDFNQSESRQVSRLIADRLYSLTDKLKATIVQYINIKIDYTAIDEKILDRIELFSKEHPGNYATILHLITEQGKVQKILSHDLSLSIDNDTLLQLRKLVGEQNVWLSL